MGQNQGSQIFTTLYGGPQIDDSRSLTSLANTNTDTLEPEAQVEEETKITETETIESHVEIEKDIKVFKNKEKDCHCVEFEYTIQFEENLLEKIFGGEKNCTVRVFVNREENDEKEGKIKENIRTKTYENISFENGKKDKLLFEFEGKEIVEIECVPLTIEIELLKNNEKSIFYFNIFQKKENNSETLNFKTLFVKEKLKVRRLNCETKEYDDVCYTLNEFFSSNEDDNDVCVVCLNETASCAILPCRHSSFCENCLKKLKLCPIDRCPIENCVRISNPKKKSPKLDNEKSKKI